MIYFASCLVDLRALGGEFAYYSKIETMPEEAKGSLSDGTRKGLVRRVTRIDEHVIDEFMDYCNFLDYEIIGKSEYEITIIVLKKYQAFLRR